MKALDVAFQLRTASASMVSLDQEGCSSCTYRRLSLTQIFLLAKISHGTHTSQSMTA